MKRLAAAMLLIALSIAPSFADAAAMDSSIIPDGTYTVTVEKVQDSQHVLVKMQNGIETVLIAQGGVDFTKIKSANIKVSLVKGKVPVFAAQ